jgi:hypothetical protein
MRKSQALDAFLILIRDRLHIANREKEDDSEFDNAYNKLYTEAMKEFSLSDSLQDCIDDGNLVQFDKTYEDNGYIIHLTISKKIK